MRDFTMRTSQIIQTENILKNNIYWNVMFYYNKGI